jgi:hypothetical protein
LLIILPGRIFDNKTMLLGYYKFMKKFLIFTLIAFVISGCSATGPTYRSLQTTISQLDQGNARLYFMRDSGFLAGGINARIQINGQTKPGLANGGFIFTDEKAGNIYIKIDGGPFNPGDANLTINAAAGKTYYFLVTPNTSNIMAGGMFGLLGSAARGDGTFLFHQISERLAKEKLKTKKLSN